MILEFAELDIGGKRSVKLAAQSEDEDAFMVALHHAFHHGDINVTAIDKDGLKMSWIHPRKPSQTQP
jgi:hypothetical protein